MSVVYLAVGSVSGTAIAVGQAVKAQLEAWGHTVVQDETPDVEGLNASGCDAVLICTATTGQGDIPANIIPFYVDLEARFPLQNGRPFGIISLGDSSYDTTFCQAGALFEERFLELQGSQPVARLTINAMETITPDEDALFWLQAWQAAALKG
ncbi:MAG: flavodoxin [Oceanospirillaceae bacterium]|nr:flavodoxin [Oceanospirillaceae bacterium]MBT11644.1 flavodoxin [Oceanospirillaceae bacterium]|tara:strand:+ start:140 stop:598 length:459 start_codon:yes stop_codon:yes gene_type:complete